MFNETGAPNCGFISSVSNTEQTVFGINADFSGNVTPSQVNGLQTDGQIWIASTALNAGGTHINVGSLVSPDGSITIGYSSPNITLRASGGVVVETFAMQTGTSPVAPLAGVVTFNGATVAAGTHPVRTDGTGAHTMALEVQISQAIASTDATKIGLSNYDSASFAVDSNGFVTFIGSTGGITWNDVSGAFSPVKNNGYFITNTATGTLPASPSQGDTIKFFVDTSAILTIQANTGQIIRLGNVVSSSAGTMTSTLQGDSVELTYRASDTCWCAIAGYTGTFVGA